jgi:SPX domain protein involved in polyphosphate accumulation
MLKARTEHREWEDIDEQDFVNALEAQLEKIHEFQREKVW